MRRAFFISLIAMTALPQSARAHIGAVPAKASYTMPPPLPATPTDGGISILDSSYAPATPSAGKYTIAWNDGDIDPTGRFSFYFFDHSPTYQVTADTIEANATPIANAQGIWTACDCSTDASVICPDLGGPRDCRNSFDWDTSQVASGSYWIIAVNNDPPFHIYNVSNTPIRITHGSDTTPPVVLVLRPDGFGAFDTSYSVQWYAVGEGPLHIDLSYGLDDVDHVNDPPTPIVSDVQGTPNVDGTTSWNWDVSALPNMSVAFLRVKVTDVHGVTSFADSIFGLSIFHSGATTDLSLGDASALFDGAGDSGNIVYIPPKKSGCEFGSTGAVSQAWLFPGAFGLAFVLFLLVRRRAQRR